MTPHVLVQACGHGVGVELSRLHGLDFPLEALAELEGAFEALQREVAVQDLVEASAMTEQANERSKAQGLAEDLAGSTPAVRPLHGRGAEHVEDCLFLLALVERAVKEGAFARSRLQVTEERQEVELVLGHARVLVEVDLALQGRARIRVEPQSHGIGHTIVARQDAAETVDLQLQASVLAPLKRLLSEEAELQIVWRVQRCGERELESLAILCREHLECCETVLSVADDQARARETFFLVGFDHCTESQGLFVIDPGATVFSVSQVADHVLCEDRVGSLAHVLGNAQCVVVDEHSVHPFGVLTEPEYLTDC